VRTFKHNDSRTSLRVEELKHWVKCGPRCQTKNENGKESEGERGRPKRSRERSSQSLKHLDEKQ